MNVVNSVVQCWGCPVFDRLFQVISKAAAAIYSEMTTWAWIILVAFWAFYSLWIVYQNTKADAKDWMYADSIKPVFINSLFACALLAMGVAFPKFVARITFEPVAEVTTVYTQAVLSTDASKVAQRVKYEPEKMDDSGFFRPALRDKIIDLMKTTITQFQSMITLGLAVVGNTFSLSILADPVGHFMALIFGVYLIVTFFRLFMRFCFYFVDVIVSLAMFAFFFPFIMVFFVFKNSKAAGWVTKMGDAFTPSLLQNVFSSIVGLAAAVITYTIVMVVVAKFFAADAISSNEIMRHILDGTITANELSDIGSINLTLLSCIVIGYLMIYLTDEIPKISADIFKAFGVSPETKLGEEIATKVEGAVKSLISTVSAKVEALQSPQKPEEKKQEPEKSEDKK